MGTESNACCAFSRVVDSSNITAACAFVSTCYEASCSCPDCQSGAVAGSRRTTPSPPPHPDWPVNDRAGVASVDWNGRNLVIAATNSSLEQILRDVSTATGVKVEGVTTDERIYGSYGPAPARDVLSQLLDGSGYNVMMVGDRGEGTPRELVLTTRTHVASQPASTNVEARQNNDDEAPEEPEPVEQSNPGVHRPFGIAPGQPGPGRNPEQIMQEMQERQQQIQSAQPQQQPQPVQPNSQPPNE